MQPALSRTYIYTCFTNNLYQHLIAWIYLLARGVFTCTVTVPVSFKVKALLSKCNVVSMETVTLMYRIDLERICRTIVWSGLNPIICCHRDNFLTATSKLRVNIPQFAGFPLGLENLENLEKWEGIFQSGKSQGILNRLEKSGKSQGKSYKILENSGNLK